MSQDDFKFSLCVIYDLEKAKIDLKDKEINRKEFDKILIKLKKEHVKWTHDQQTRFTTGMPHPSFYEDKTKYLEKKKRRDVLREAFE